MKKLVSVIEVEGEGLGSLMGERVILLCANYFYTGKLVGVNDTVVALEDAAIVYETGPWSDKSFKDSQKLPGSMWYVQTGAVESFGAVAK